jgi:hypothetical protein
MHHHRQPTLATRLALGVLIPLGLAACAVWMAGDAALPAESISANLLQNHPAAAATWRAMLSGGLLLAALGTALALLHSNIRSILEPLEEARAALEALSRGDYDRQVRIRRIDEIGDVLIAIDDLSQYLAVMLPEEDDVSPEPASPTPVPRPVGPARTVTVPAVPDFDHIVDQMLDDDGNGPFIVDGGTTAVWRTEPGSARIVDQV